MDGNDMQKKYLKSLNWFRGLAIIFVYLSHLPKNNVPFNADIFMRSVFGNGTLFFVFISGYLFWHLKDRFEYISYMENKFKNVVSPYIFILLPVLVLSAFLNLGTVDINITKLFSENGLFWHLLMGGTNLNTPLWFIPMIILFFITSPIFIQIGNSKYFNLILCLAISFSILSFRPDLGKYPLYSYFHFLGVYLLGIFMKKNELYIFKYSKNISIASFIAFIAFIAIDINFGFFGEHRHFFAPFFSDVMSINYIGLNQIQKIFGVLFFLSVLFYIENKYKNIEFPMLDKLAKYSFGIFFVHYYWLHILKYTLTNISYSYFIIAILGFVLSVFSVYLFKKLLQLFNVESRYFIGC
jgi:peptidoglycan/LPS O-acetylase OafA/YrhL